MKITPIGQSGYIVKTVKSEIVIDPYLSDSVFKASGKERMIPSPIDPKTIKCDAVICTHNHLDHLDPDTVSEIHENQFYITTAEGVEKLKTLGRSNAVYLPLGDSINVGDFKITAVFALHSCEAMGVIVEAEGKKLYFSGDTLFDERLFEIASYKPDVTFICINGKLGNMNVNEALITAKKIGAKINVPTHYDMFASNTENPLLFSENIEGSMVLEAGNEYEF